ncbi:MAG: Gfo/Idh/MocA family oxidoreductase [Chloroflexi bacterium]|nr:Gfo/Idh/MocA family oxidoreductase [Chloroflexota bacterium]
MFARPLLEDYGDVAALVALCDHNAARMNAAKRLLGVDLPTYTDFGHMLAETHPDVVIVCTIDGTHHRFIIEALEAGCDVITEKPLTITAEKARAILEAEKRTGRAVRVSFNARYGAPAEAIYRLLHDGVIGEVLSADFVEFLNTSHGADYFRRWHRRKENSGGLLLHKASHHFDQLNWWLSAVDAGEAVSVYAQGGLRYYGPRGAERLGLQDHGERCLTCPRSGDCPFFLDLRANERLRALYLEAEHEDGYFRDRCPFAAEIDIEDRISALILYRGGQTVSYSLDAYLPYEGQRIGFNGTRGRLEVDLVSHYHRPNELGILEVQPTDTPVVVRVNPTFGQPYTVPIALREGGHGGADERIREHLFRPDTPDPLNQRADSLAGARAVLIGDAANRSLQTGRPVRIDGLYLMDI